MSRGLTVPDATQPQAPKAIALVGGDKGVLAHELMTGLMGAVSAYAGKKVLVGFHGDVAFCTSKQNYVNIPQLPPTRIIPTSIARELKGFVAHESAHLVWTDWAAMEAVPAAEQADPLFKEIHNAIEDYMIERNWLLVYPGDHKNFTATEERCCRKYMELYGSNPDIAKDLRVSGAVALTWCRAINFGLKTTASADCLKTMPASLQQRVWRWFQDMIDVETTQDCIDAARAVIVDINANPYDPADPPANTNPPPKNQQGGVQGQGGGGTGHAPLSTGRNVDDAIQDAGGADCSPVTIALSSTIDSGPSAGILADPEGVKTVEDIRPRIASAIGTVARILKRSLVALAKDRWKSGRADGSLDDKRLAGVILGHTEIYRKKVSAPELSTAVSILIDCSGSMSDTIQLCQQLALILQSAFAGTPVKFEILGYTSADSDALPPDVQTMMQAISQQTGQAPAINGVHIYEFKAFDASHHVALTTIGNMTKVEMGGTPTGDAVLIAHGRLAKRKERRHVMMVLTDGAPDDVQKCKKSVKAVEKNGVTVLGVAIASGAVKSCFTDHVVVNSANDLPALVMSKISAMLFNDRGKVGQNQTDRNATAHIRAG